MAIKHPLPWSLRVNNSFYVADILSYSISIFDSNDVCVKQNIISCNLDEAKEFIDKINATQVYIPESRAKIWLVQEPNGCYLRNSKNNDWTYEVSLARKFKRRSDAQNCINRLPDNIEAKPIYKEIF